MTALVDSKVDTPIGIFFSIGKSSLTLKLFRLKVRLPNLTLRLLRVKVSLPNLNSGLLRVKVSLPNLNLRLLGEEN